jgi:hypothetical protein
MAIKLKKRESMWARRGQVIGKNSTPIQYEVDGLPQGDLALLQEVPHAGWCIIRTKGGVDSQSGMYGSADEALSVIQREFHSHA